MRLIAAEILYALACFTLQEVPRGHGVWTLAGIALIGAALPAMLALAETPHEPPPRTTVTGVRRALLLFAALQLAYGAMRVVKEKVIDIGTTTFAALAALAHGGNPYALPIDLIASDVHGYKYLPAMLVAYAPLGFLGLRGIVLTNLVLHAGTAAALAAIAARRAGPVAGYAAAAAYLSIPFFTFQLSRGANDLVPLLPLLLALLVAERRPFAAGALVGLSLAAKLMPGAAALLILLPAPGRRRSYALGLMMGLAPILPFLLWSPDAFACNILLFNALRPIDDTSWFYGLPAIAVPLARSIAALALLALFVGVWRRPPVLEARLALMAGAILLVFAVGPDMHHNYYLWFLPLLAPLAAWAALGKSA